MSISIFNYKYNKIKFLYLSFYVIFISILLHADTEQTNLNVGYIKLFPPQYSISENGKPIGFAADTIEYIAKKADFTINYIAKENWADLFIALETGEIDLIPNQGITESRMKLFSFSIPVEIFPVHIFTRTSYKELSDIKSLNNKSVAVVNTNVGEVLVKGATEANIKVFNDFENALFDLLAGNSDALISPDPVILNLARKINVEDQIKSNGPVLAEIKRGVSVLKGNEWILDKINPIIKQFLLSDEYKEIYMKWNGKPKPFWTIEKTIIAMSIISTVLIFLILIWKYFSTEQIVKERTKELKDSDSTFRSLFENTPLGTAYHKMIYDESGKPINYSILKVNQSYIKLTGIDDPTGKFVTDVFTGIEEDVFNWIKIFGNVAKNGNEIRIQQHLKSNDRWFDLVAYQNKKDHFVATIFDITEGKKAEEKLKISEEKFRALYDNAPLSYQSLNEDGSFRDINPTWLKTLGYNRDEVLGKFFIDFLHPDWQPHFETNFPKFKKRGYVNDVQFKIRHKNGHYLDIAFEGCIGYYPNGSFRQTYCVFTDITERKKIEQELLKSEEKYRIIIQDSPVGIYQTDDKGMCVFANPSWYKMAGLTNKETMGNGWTNALFEEDREFVIQSWQHMVESNGSWGQEFRIQNSNGDIYWVFGTATGIYNENNEVTGYIGINTDISKRKQAQEALKKSKEQLHQNQKMEAIGQLAGGIAHDFNNSLAAILGASEIIRNQEYDINKQTKYLDMIISSAERAGELTKKLLLFSRKGRKLSSNVDVLEVINETVNLLEHTMNKNISISIVNNSIKTKIIGDDSMLQNAMMNLAINSSHAMLNGGEIIFTLENRSLDSEYCNTSPFELEPGEYLKIIIQDSGTGMTPETKEHIFEPFFTTKKQGKGTGIGLSTVYGAVKDHHGAIEVYSEIDRGTEFHLLFPLGVQISNNIEKKEVIAGSGNILVIDDEELIRLTSKAMLESLGYNVMCAENGKIGLQMFSENRSYIDLILLDMIMPVMGGREAFTKIRDIDNNIPIIISSGFSKDSDIEELKDKGVSDFIHKPFRLIDLSESVARILDGMDKE